MDSIEKAKQVLADRRFERDTQKQTLRSQFFDDMVRLSRGEQVNLSYVPNAIDCQAISENEIDEIKAAATTLIEQYQWSLKREELSDARTAADDAWLQMVADQKAQREKLAAARNLATNAHQTAQNAASIIAELRKKFPEFADVVLGADSKPKTKRTARA